MVSKNIRDIREPLDVDLQQIAIELDTSVSDMKYIGVDLMTDANSVDAFNRLVDDIVNQNGVEITAFDDNTSLYEYRGESIIIHQVLGSFYVLFDSSITRKLEAGLNRCR